mgnify:CR=1 FL=1|jgi:hypothetical protein
MNKPSTKISPDAVRNGTFKYLDDSVHPSLYRNGEVLTRRDADGSDGGRKGVNLETREMMIHNARLLDHERRRTVESHGFEWLTRPRGNRNLDFFNHRDVVGEYYPECARIVADATGARAYAFDHNVRSALGKQSQQKIVGGQQVQGPAHVVHGDYTLTSAPQRLRDLALPPSGNDTLRGILADDESLISQQDVDRALEDGKRFAIINVWRNIADEPVATHPIALCDGQTVDPQELVVFEIHYQDRIGENYFAKHADGHQWYYYPDMTGDEALLIKQWDSAGVLADSNGARGDGTAPERPCTFSFHSAFEDSATPDDAPDRWSIEVRCIVIYD